MNIMQNLSDYIYEAQENKSFILETINEMNIMTINESFQSKILTNLAKAIKKFEQPAHNRDIEREKREREQHDKRNLERKVNGYPETEYHKSKPDALSFASVFGPGNARVPMSKSKYTSYKDMRIRGVKWAEITDNMFTKYDGYDAKFQKIFKKLCNGKKAFLAIACEPETDTIVYVVRGFDESNELSFWELAQNRSKYNKETGFVRKNKPKGRWQERDYKGMEMLEDMNDYDVYLLEITDNMKSEYNLLYNDRKEAQQGVINYDKDSLKAIAAQQRARYKKLSAELRAKRLQENPKALYDDIKELNDRVIAVYDKIMSDEKYVGEYYGIGNLMSYVENCFSQYYDYLRSKKDADDYKKHAEEKGRKYDDSNYYIERMNNEINYVKDRIDRAKKEIQAAEERLAA